MTSLKQIDKRCDYVGTNAAKLNTYIHDTAAMIVEHACGIDKTGNLNLDKAGDCTRALVLVMAMPASMRRQMLIQSFSKYTPIRVVLAKGNAPASVCFSDTYKALTPAKKAAKWDVAGFKANPFFQLADKVPENREYTLAQLIAMFQSVGKKIKEKKAEGKIAANDVEKADALVLKMEAALAA